MRIKTECNSLYSLDDYYLDVSIDFIIEILLVDKFGNEYEKTLKVYDSN